MHDTRRELVSLDLDRGGWRVCAVRVVVRLCSLGKEDGVG